MTRGGRPTLKPPYLLNHASVRKTKHITILAIQYSSLWARVRGKSFPDLTCPPHSCHTSTSAGVKPQAPVNVAGPLPVVSV